jgi:hypothetical protein
MDPARDPLVHRTLAWRGTPWSENDCATCESPVQKGIASKIHPIGFATRAAISAPTAAIAQQPPIATTVTQ